MERFETIPRTTDGFLKVVLSSVILWQLFTIILSLASGKVYLQQIPLRSNFDSLDPTRQTEPIHQKRVLVIASVPKDQRHVYTLWSELECFSTNVDLVVVSAPTWSREITEKITDFARISIPRFSSGETKLETQYHINDRYDVGLWCDALNALDMNAFDEFGIVNDSIFALRMYSGIFDSLKERNVSLSSLSYSYTAKYFKGYGPEYFWVESVFRGLTKEGLKTFMNHSCVDANHPLFCADGSPQRRKECIILHFEQDLAALYPRDNVYGLFFSDAPPEMKTGSNSHSHTWVVNPLYWRHLVEKMNFPAAKENVQGVIDNLQDPILGNCTRYLNTTNFDTMGFDFSVAAPGLG